MPAFAGIPAVVQIDPDALPVPAAIDCDHDFKRTFNVHVYIDSYRRATTANGYPDQYRPLHLYRPIAGLAPNPHHDMSYAERQAVVAQLARGLIMGPYVLDVSEGKDNSWRPL